MTTQNSRAYITTGGEDHPHKHVSLKGVDNSDKKEKQKAEFIDELFCAQKNTILCTLDMPEVLQVFEKPLSKEEIRKE